MLSRAGQAIFVQDGQQIDPWRQLKADGILGVDDTGPSDFFMANLESPLGMETVSAEMNLCSNPSEIRVLQRGQLDLLTLVNNHRDDCLAGGDLQTARYLAESDIPSVRVADQPYYLETPQGSIAVLAVEEVTARLDETALLNAVSGAREKAGMVIVSIHWGNEYQSGPDVRQQALAQQLADAGADVVWGHHPHVLQKMEWLTAADGRQTLVLYSLGNLLADQWMLEDAQRSALIRLSITDLMIGKIEVIPVTLDRQTRLLTLSKEYQDIFERLKLSSMSDDSVQIVERTSP